MAANKKKWKQEESLREGKREMYKKPGMRKRNVRGGRKEKRKEKKKKIPGGPRKLAKEREHKKKRVGLPRRAGRA